ncbi:MAG TPA: DUF402 domain-containing protein [Chloroflexota bacterium]
MGDDQVTIHKLAYDGRETWKWSGRMVERLDGAMVVDAVFNGPPRDLGYMKLEGTDLYHEYYFDDRWFNVFQVFRADGVLKGWYCNICQPANFSGADVFFVDMVLDVFVYPDGRTLVLDEDDFAVKEESIYSAADAARARKAVTELLDMVARRQQPFDAIGREKGEG